MMRITNNMIHNNMVYNLSQQQRQMEKSQMEGATGTRINKPSDDPAGAARKMSYTTRLNELGQYEKNVTESQGRMQMAHSHLSSVADVLQRIRELTVQAANGTNGDFERHESIAREIEEQLLLLVELANSKDATGKNIFGGSVIERDAFRAIYSNTVVDGVDNGRALTGVVYQGDNLGLLREIERFTRIEASIPGSEVFWGTNMSIAANKDSSGFIALSDGAFTIDGVRIEVNAGDTLNEIVEKINNAPVEVTASIGGRADLVLTSDTPHQIWLEDVEGATFLQDLGLIDPASPTPGNNYSPFAEVSGKSLFDVVIQLRDDLLNNDIISIGGRDLEGLDMAIENVSRYRGEVDARINRLDLHFRRITWDGTLTQELMSKNEGVDLAENIMNYKWMQNIHEYSLRVGANLIRPTLMDFLR